jgi:hypothetical protein
VLEEGGRGLIWWVFLKGLTGEDGAGSGQVKVWQGKLEPPLHPPIPLRTRTSNLAQTHTHTDTQTHTYTHVRAADNATNGRADQGSIGF